MKTTFAYNLPAAGTVTLDIYNILGTKVKTLVKEFQAAGDHTVTMDADFAQTGVYIATLKLEADGKQYDAMIKIIRNQ
jgi:serine protease AprX